MAIFDRFLTAAAAIAVGVTPAYAQWGGAGSAGGSGVDLDTAVDAAILSSVARDREAERNARNQPYASPGYGPIASAASAAEACGRSALDEVAPGAKLSVPPRARTMSTGWEVEGLIATGGSGTVPFICSVRNGSVSGIKIGE